MMKYFLFSFVKLYIYIKKIKMSLIKVRVLEFQNNSYFDESPHLGKTLLLPLSNVTESKSFEKVNIYLNLYFYI